MRSTTLPLVEQFPVPSAQSKPRAFLVVVDKSSGWVIEINDCDYCETEAVQLGPEHLTDADKKYIASAFIRSVYQIDPAT